MAAELAGKLPLRSEHDIVMARQQVRAMCQSLKFSLVDQTKMVTAASELARNTLIHGGGGDMRWNVLEDGARRGLQLHFEDEGPGIANMQLAMSDGWTSGTGMGLGLPGSKRLVNDFDIESAPGKGTRVSITKWK
ncbi:anti-sigma regulatory factor [Variovorax sp. OV329]|uniref:anti-sigma regulatory factor n=1 Tax=Variovorax sp. OV329 TaxID=1882825 RepID=UPI0008E4A436|nr:anti-sigma regulatory factor [Variovorax sp. OV329]SFM58555.1 serine/threonine-protein kinase RsbT [Variovorax sp. OV329]